jgi:hypothetical protein
MRREMTETESKISRVCKLQQIGIEYRQGMRNPDDEARAKFKADMRVRGTRAWAVCQANAMGRGVEVDSETAELVLQTLQSR